MEKIWALSDDEVDFYFAELFKQGGAQNELPSGQFWIRRYSKLIATGSSGFINLIQSMEKDIRAYNKAQSTSLKKICDDCEHLW